LSQFINDDDDDNHDDARAELISLFAEFYTDTVYSRVLKQL